MFFVELGLAVFAWLGLEEKAIWQEDHWACEGVVIEKAQEDDEIVLCNGTIIDLGG